MLAAENGALPGGKVGGMGDVIGALPDALAELGCSVTVVTPAYGVFQQLEGATNEGTVKTTVGGETHDVSVVRLRAQEPDTHVEYWALDHPRFTACGSGRIYCDDPPDQPFATDAEKFALFCFAAGECLIESVLPQPDIIHLHDWHTALIALLRAHHKRYRSLRQSRCVFTIHNLAYQGIRPLRGDYSTLQSWSPELRPKLDQIRDPRWPDCLNLMRTGITLSEDYCLGRQAFHGEEPVCPAELEDRGPQEDGDGGDDEDRRNGGEQEQSPSVGPVDELQTEQEGHQAKSQRRDRHPANPAVRHRVGAGLGLHSPATSAATPTSWAEPWQSMQDMWSEKSCDSVSSSVWASIDSQSFDSA